MATYECNNCGSSDVFILEVGPHKGLFCSKCGVWIKWIKKKELPLVEQHIENTRLEIATTGRGKIVTYRIPVPKQKEELR